MKYLDRLARRLGWLRIPHLTLILVAGQAFFYIVSTIMGMVDYTQLVLHWPSVLRGEVWRLVFFLFTPPFSNPLFAFFSLYILYLMGSALENAWGDFKYTVYVGFTGLVVLVATILIPWAAGTALPVEFAILLGFAYLFPDFQLRIFFVLPVKIKWLAALGAAGQVYSFFTSDISGKAMVVASFASFALFFGPDFVRGLTTRRRRRTLQKAVDEAQPSHSCVVCGRSRADDPHLDLRYCTDCTPPACYCPDHLHDHVHVGEGN